MSNYFKIKIHPWEDYCRYESSDWILCMLSFDVKIADKTFKRKFESCQLFVVNLLDYLNRFLEGEINTKDTFKEPVPYIAGEATLYPYQFTIIPNSNNPHWTFTFYKQEFNKSGGHDIIFTADLSKDVLLSLRDSLLEEYQKFDWKHAGEFEYYKFNLPASKYIQAYSAKQFEITMSKLCTGHRIEELYVGIQNYADPCSIGKDYVNYYLGSQILIEFDSFVLDMLIHAEGLFEYRILDGLKLQGGTPLVGCIPQDYDNDTLFCRICEKYFPIIQVKTIDEISVAPTAFSAFTPRTFNAGKLELSKELPRRIRFCNHTDKISLSLLGGFDDFTVQLERY